MRLVRQNTGRAVAATVVLAAATASFAEACGGSKYPRGADDALGAGAVHVRASIVHVDIMSELMICKPSDDPCSAWEPLMLDTLLEIFSTTNPNAVPLNTTMWAAVDWFSCIAQDLKLEVRANSYFFALRNAPGISISSDWEIIGYGP